MGRDRNRYVCEFRDFRQKVSVSFSRDFYKKTARMKFLDAFDSANLALKTFLYSERREFTKRNRIMCLNYKKVRKVFARVRIAIETIIRCMAFAS